jgi:hypothetical protein
MSLAYAYAICFCVGVRQAAVLVTNDVRDIEKGSGMSAEKRLLPASILFGVLWAVGMIWWSERDAISILIWLIGGLLAGVLWYYAMRWWLRWWERRSHSRP